MFPVLRSVAGTGEGPGDRFREAIEANFLAHNASRSRCGLGLSSQPVRAFGADKGRGEGRRLKERGREE